MIANRTGFNYEDHLFRFLQKLRLYRKIFFLPVSRPLSFLFIKLKVRREVRKNALDAIDNVLQALSFGVSYSFVTSTEGDILEFGAQTGEKATILRNNVNYYNSKLDLAYAAELCESFLGRNPSYLE